MMQERGYQINSVSSGVEYLLDKSKRGGGVIVAPTGAGKSYIIALIIEKLGGKGILVVQPTVELLEQNYEKIVSLGIKPEIYSASKNSKKVGDVTYATTMSLKDPKVFKGVKYVIQDECHLGTTKGTQFNTFIKALGIQRYIGTTATPLYLTSSMTGVELKFMTRTRGGLYNKMIHVTQIREMIRLGFWSKLVYDVVELDKSVLEPNVSGSEYSDDSVDRFYNVNDLGTRIKEKIRENSSRKSILVFAPSIAKAEELKRQIPGSEIIVSSTKPKERKRILDGFKSLKIRVVINVNVLSVGFDHPELDMIMDCNPTLSFARHYQKWGRGVRIAEGKKNCLIVDYAEGLSKFGRLEDVTIEDIPTFGWGVFSNGYLISNTPLSIKNKVHKSALKENKKRIRTSRMKAEKSPRILFGKMKGLTVAEAYNKDKGYLMWFYKTIDPQTLQLQKIMKAIEAIMQI